MFAWWLRKHKGRKDRDPENTYFSLACIQKFPEHIGLVLTYWTIKQMMQSLPPNTHTLPGEGQISSRMDQTVARHLKEDAWKSVWMDREDGGGEGMKRGKDGKPTWDTGRNGDYKYYPGWYTNFITQSWALCLHIFSKCCAGNEWVVRGQDTNTRRTLFLPLGITA